MIFATICESFNAIGERVDFIRFLEFFKTRLYVILHKRYRTRIDVSTMHDENAVSVIFVVGSPKSQIW